MAISVWCKLVRENQENREKRKNRFPIGDPEGAGDALARGPIRESWPAIVRVAPASAKAALSWSLRSPLQFGERAGSGGLLLDGCSTCRSLDLYGAIIVKSSVSAPCLPCALSLPSTASQEDVAWH